MCRVSSPPWALVNAAMAGVDNVEIKAMGSRTLSMMVSHDVNGFQITSFNPPLVICAMNDADRETRSKRALFPLTIYDLFTSACSTSISTAKVSRYEHSLCQKLTSDSRQAESALNGPS